MKRNNIPSSESLIDPVSSIGYSDDDVDLPEPPTSIVRSAKSASSQGPDLETGVHANIQSWGLSSAEDFWHSTSDDVVGKVHIIC